MKSGDTGNNKFWDFCTKGSFLETLLFFEEFAEFSPNTNPGPGCFKPAPRKNLSKEESISDVWGYRKFKISGLFKEGKFFGKNTFLTPGGCLCLWGPKIPCIKVVFSPKITRGQLWEWSRMVPGAFLSIVCENGVKISKNKKYNFFAFYRNFGNYPKGGPLGSKIFKIVQSPPNLQDW